MKILNVFFLTSVSLLVTAIFAAQAIDPFDLLLYPDKKSPEKMEQNSRQDLFTNANLETTIVTKEFKKLKLGQNITGQVEAAFMTRSHQECALRCLDDRNYYAYKYIEARPKNCILIQKNCSAAEEHIFENDYSSIIYEKVYGSTSDANWKPPSDWIGPQAAFYRSFDNLAGLILMEGIQEMNYVSMVSGKVNSALTLDHTKRQWVDLGIHCETCLTRPETCGAAGGAVSLWMKVISCPSFGGIISSAPEYSTGSHIYCGTNEIGSWINLPDGDFHLYYNRPSGWFHVVINYIGPNNGQGIRMFIDGSELMSDTAKDAWSFSAGDGMVVVGRDYTDADKEYASVQVDELIFFNQVLSNDHINKLYNAV